MRATYLIAIFAAGVSLCCAGGAAASDGALAGGRPYVEAIEAFMADDEAEGLRLALQGLFAPWKSLLTQQGRYHCRKAQQMDLFSSYDPSHYNFIVYTFDGDHRLSAASAARLEQSLQVRIPELADAREELAALLTPLFRRAIDTLALREGLQGDHPIRTILRLFVVNVDGRRRQGDFANSLSWHWDYCAKTTITSELYSDFLPAAVLMAQNTLAAPLPDPTKPASHRDAVPDRKTITLHAYPPNGALMFEARQGAIVHAPSPLRAPPHSSGVLLRAVLQVVLFDEEWPIPTTPSAQRVAAG